MTSLATPRDTSPGETVVPARLPPAESAGARLPVRLLAFLAGVLVMFSFRAVGDRYYGGFSIPQGTGMTNLVPEEMGFLLLFTTFGATALALLAVALEGGTLDAQAATLLRRGAPSAWAAGGAMAVVLSSATVGVLFLNRSVTTDDEHVYRFIGQTLRGGSLVALSPGTDLEFFREQFVVITPGARYGKYPIGHPLLLAAGQAVGLEHLVVPLILGLTALALRWLGGAASFGRATSTAAVLLFVLSPQVLLTGATVLSQPACALCVTVALAAVLHGERNGSRSLLAVAGAALGYGFLVRPLPTLFFVGVVVGYLFWRVIPRQASRRSALDWLAFTCPLVAAVGMFLLVNRAQTGGALTTGYQTFHGVTPGGGGLLETLAAADLANASMSIVASLLRLNVWLLGWPFAVVLASFARRRPQSALLAACLGAELLYRVLSPKAGVGGTGPIYFFEVVPVLCLLCADGAARLAEWRARRPQVGVPGASALILAGSLVSGAMFLPPRLADLHRMGSAQAVAPTLLRAHDRGPALLFHEGIVPPWTRLSWAYFPPCNGPTLDGDVLYLRLQRVGGLQQNLDLWKRRFPERSAWYFRWPPQGPPEIMPLESYVRGHAEAQGTAP